MTWFRPIGAALIVGAAAVGYQLLQPEPVYAHVPITTKIVFNREIAQIFQKKCFQCHTDGNVSVPLTTYKEARPWAVAIKEEILERQCRLERGGRLRSFRQRHEPDGARDQPDPVGRMAARRAACCWPTKTSSRCSFRR